MKQKKPGNSCVIARPSFNQFEISYCPIKTFQSYEKKQEKSSLLFEI
jgi:hypothetical protein